MAAMAVLIAIIAIFTGIFQPDIREKFLGHAASATEAGALKPSPQAPLAEKK